MFEELADWPGPDPERLPDDLAAAAGVPPVSELKDSDDPWDQLMCIVLRGVQRGDPEKDHIPTQEEWDQMERDGEDPAAIAVLQFILQQTPPPPGCLDVPRLLKILRENLPKRPLVLPPPPKVEVEWDYPPGHPFAGRERRGRAETAATAAQTTPLGSRKVFRKVRARTTRTASASRSPIVFGNTELQKPGAFPPPPPSGGVEESKGAWFVFVCLVCLAASRDQQSNGPLPPVELRPGRR